MMKKKKLLRFSKRLLILLLCSTLVSGTCFNKYRISANATSLVASVGAYTLYEICMYVGTLLVSGIGIGFVVDNRDQIAQMGKDFIDACNIDELSGWMFSKVDTTGSSYVYGTEALQEVKSTSFEVIQGGGNAPKNDDDGDGEDDKTPYELRTEELQRTGMWATTSFTYWLSNQIESLRNKMDSGEETFLNNYFPELQYDGTLERDYKGNYISRVVSVEHGGNYKYVISATTSFRIACVYEKEMIYYYSNEGGGCGAYAPYYQCYELKKDGWHLYSSSSGKNGFWAISYDANIPVFGSKAACENYFETGDDSECLNMANNYRIADWLKENWQGSIDAVNSGIRSLYDNMLIVGAAANQAMQNQLNGLGYIEDLLARLAAALALALPDNISDPEYLPDTSEEPKLDKLPWEGVVPVPDPNPSPEPVPDPDPSDPDPSDPEDPKMKFGINTIFSILLLLIMIIIMLLIIFISCLAFIIMIFRIQATTGFLPDEMVAALNYLKTLQIPGFGMSVYSFFMALIYIILIFTIVGILRKNIDKIKFPRKGGK